MKPHVIRDWPLTTCYLVVVSTVVLILEIVELLLR